MAVPTGRSTPFPFSRHPPDPDFDPAPFAGAWEIMFGRSPSGCDLETKLLLDLDLSVDGSGEAPRASDRSGERLLGTFEPQIVHVSPSGRIRIEGTYTRSSESGPCSPYPVESYELALLGLLQSRDRPDGSAVGGGTAQVSLDWALSDVTQWTARSQP